MNKNSENIILDCDLSTNEAKFCLKTSNNEVQKNSIFSCNAYDLCEKIPKIMEKIGGKINEVIAINVLVNGKKNITTQRILLSFLNGLFWNKNTKIDIKTI